MSEHAFTNRPPPELRTLEERVSGTASRPESHEVEPSQELVALLGHVLAYLEEREQGLSDRVMLDADAARVKEPGPWERMLKAAQDEDLARVRELRRHVAEAIGRCG